MYLEILIIKAIERYYRKTDYSTRPKEYFFSLIKKSALQHLSPIISCTYSAKKYVFAQLLGFTCFFMYDLIISYQSVCRVWMRGVAREIRKVLKMRNGKMFDKVMQPPMAGAYLMQCESKIGFSNILINMIKKIFKQI